MTGTDEEGRPLVGPGSWRLRRRFLYVINLFCAAVVTYVLGSGLDTAPADTAVNMAFVTMLGSVGSYVFGAAWEDIKRKV